MRRFHLWFSLIALLAVAAGVYFSADNGVFWLVSTDQADQEIRLGLAGIVAVQLMFEPPRHFLIRLLTMVSAIGAGWWSICTINMIDLPIFDAILYMQTALALAISALEVTYSFPAIARANNYARIHR